MRLTNLRLLRVFDAVARLSSFVEASKALHMTPAAVSLAIRDLESSLDFRVFERTTRHVRLTEAGRKFFVCVERVLTEIRATESCAASLRAGNNFDTVRVATTPAVISSLLGVVLERAPVLWPNVRITCVEVPSHQLVEAIDLRAADITIGVRLPNDDFHESQPLFVSRWVALVPRTHALAGHRSLTWRQIQNVSLIIINESSRLRIQSALPADLVLENVHSVSTAMFAVASAANGGGIVVVPGYVSPLALLHNLDVVPITEPDIPHLLEIGVSRQPKPDPHILQIRDFLVEQVQETYKDLA
ncbi:LysR family transcriptional regulator [Paraburkholderia acidisoli]|uniref:LysR family transcriptional regulator n=1 Tax=Paraburkholderia acidisoli TaxID=2571748 RepID=A0A7Z2JHF3_9BURK|nr:LysR family transcriptional regulator [Paraburkholderia acidisoli]QGZ63354.1 LysR family transcriptional regulator [Paraburkholderia acidisoli]